MSGGACGLARGRPSLAPPVDPGPALRPGAKRALPAVRRALESHGLLLIADRELPSIATLMAGEPVSGSWWSHPLAHEIYDVCQWLEDEPGVAQVKLLKGKVTFVHPRLVASVAAVGAAREPWQLRALTPAAKRLLALCDERGTVRMDELALRGRARRRPASSSAGCWSGPTTCTANPEPTCAGCGAGRPSARASRPRPRPSEPRRAARRSRRRRPPCRE